MSGSEADSESYVIEALRTAAQIEMSILEFWQITPFEFSLMVKAYNSRKETERDDRLTLEYLNAAWQRAKRMPKLESVIHSEQPKSAEQTPEQMLEKIKQLNALFGGEVK